jgi:5-methylcytosine-specific restriction protein A
MPWQNTPGDRQRSDAAYRNAEYKRNRQQCMRLANWRCQIQMEGCAGAASQVDHIVPVSRGGTHELTNLRAACRSCHAKVTAQQGGGWRHDSNRAEPQPRPATDW